MDSESSPLLEEHPHARVHPTTVVRITARVEALVMELLPIQVDQGEAESRAGEAKGRRRDIRGSWGDPLGTSARRRKRTQLTSSTPTQRSSRHRPRPSSRLKLSTRSPSSLETSQRSSPSPSSKRVATSTEHRTSIRATATKTGVGRSHVRRWQGNSSQGCLIRISMHCCRRGTP